MRLGQKKLNGRYNTIKKSGIFAQRSNTDMTSNFSWENMFQEHSKNSKGKHELSLLCFQKTNKQNFNYSGVKPLHVGVMDLT